jgi:hypothetical protein
MEDLTTAGALAKFVARCSAGQGDTRHAGKLTHGVRVFCDANVTHAVLDATSLRDSLPAILAVRKHVQQMGLRATCPAWSVEGKYRFVVSAASNPPGTDTYTPSAARRD